LDSTTVHPTTKAATSRMWGSRSPGTAMASVRSMAEASLTTTVVTVVATTLIFPVTFAAVRFTPLLTVVMPPTPGEASPVDGEGV